MDQNEIQKLILSCGCLISPKGAKQFNTERKVYSTNGTGMKRYPYRKRNAYILTLYLYAVLCLVTQSSPTLCNPMDCSLPGSSVQGDSPGKDTGVDCRASSRDESQLPDAKFESIILFI